MAVMSRSAVSGYLAVTALATEIMALATEEFRTLAEADSIRFLPTWHVVEQPVRPLAQAGRPVEKLGPEQAVTIRRAQPLPARLRHVVGQSVQPARSGGSA